MADLSRPAQDCVAAQGNMFDRAKREHGLTINVLHVSTRISKSTLRAWQNGAAMPAWAIGALGEAGIPDHLLSLVTAPFGRCVVTEEDGEGDLDTAAVDAGEFSHAVQRARHPASPGGVAIVPQEVAAIVPLKQRATASLRRARA